MKTQKQEAEYEAQSRLSEFDKNAIKVLRCLVPDQEMHLTGVGDCGTWDSKCIVKDGLAITTIVKNGKTLVRILYDYETSTEQEFWVAE